MVFTVEIPELSLANSTFEKNIMIAAGAFQLQPLKNR